MGHTHLALDEKTSLTISSKSMGPNKVLFELNSQ